MFQNLQTATVRTIVARSQIDQIERVYGYARVQDYPLMVHVGIGMDDILAPARNERRIWYVVAVILTLILILLSSGLVHGTNRRRTRPDELILRQQLHVEAARHTMS